MHDSGVSLLPHTLTKETQSKHLVGTFTTWLKQRVSRKAREKLIGFFVNKKVFFWKQTAPECVLCVEEVEKDPCWRDVKGRCRKDFVVFMIKTCYQS